MIAPIQPLPSYDSNNESQFRSQARQADLMNVKKNQPIDSLIWIDEADGAPYRVTLNGGAWVITAITP